VCIEVRPITNEEEEGERERERESSMIVYSFIKTHFVMQIYGDERYDSREFYTSLQIFSVCKKEEER
jgi:hypothetical protein